MDYMITYKKKNGEIINRKRKTYPPYKMGEETSMGWTILDIKYLYKENYYSEYERNKLLDKDRKRLFKRKKIINLFTKKFDTLISCILIFCLLEIFKLLLER